jgi:hypothetical protein
VKKTHNMGWMGRVNRLKLQLARVKAYALNHGRSWKTTSVSGPADNQAWVTGTGQDRPVQYYIQTRFMQKPLEWVAAWTDSSGRPVSDSYIM